MSELHSHLKSALNKRRNIINDEDGEEHPIIEPIDANLPDPMEAIREEVANNGEKAVKVIIDELRKEVGPEILEESVEDILQVPVPVLNKERELSKAIESMEKIIEELPLSGKAMITNSREEFVNLNKQIKNLIKNFPEENKNVYENKLLELRKLFGTTVTYSKEIRKVETKQNRNQKAKERGKLGRQLAKLYREGKLSEGQYSSELSKLSEEEQKIAIKASKLSPKEKQAAIDAIENVHNLYEEPERLSRAEMDAMRDEVGIPNQAGPLVPRRLQSLPPNQLTTQDLIALEKSLLPKELLKKIVDAYGPIEPGSKAEKKVEEAIKQALKKKGFKLNKEIKFGKYKPLKAEARTKIRAKLQGRLTKNVTERGPLATDIYEKVAIQKLRPRFQKVAVKRNYTPALNEEKNYRSTYKALEDVHKRLAKLAKGGSSINIKLIPKEVEKEIIKRFGPLSQGMGKKKIESLVKAQLKKLGFSKLFKSIEFGKYKRLRSSKNKVIRSRLRKKVNGGILPIVALVASAVAPILLRKFYDKGPKGLPFPDISTIVARKLVGEGGCMDCGGTCGGSMVLNSGFLKS
jgi:hypothetical protein